MYYCTSWVQWLETQLCSWAMGRCCALEQCVSAMKPAPQAALHFWAFPKLCQCWVGLPFLKYPPPSYQSWVLCCSRVWWGGLSWSDSKSESYLSGRLRDVLFRTAVCADTCDSEVLLEPVKPNWVSLQYTPKSHCYRECRLRGFWQEFKY